MSKTVGFLVLFIALVSGLFASATVMKYIQSQRAALTTKSNASMAKVVITQKEIPAGTTITAEHIAVVDRSKETVPASGFANAKDVIGRMVKSTIYKDEIVLNERLVEPGAPGGLPALIPKGMRAVTLRVDDTISVGGFVQPGHHVDIVTTVDLRGNENETVSKVILQNIRVLATGQEIERKEEEKSKVVPTVTVLVTLEQAERLVLATNAGTIRLVLRNHHDTSEDPTNGIKLSNLVTTGIQELVPPTLEKTPILNEEPDPRANVRIVEVFRRAERTEVVFNQ